MSLRLLRPVLLAADFKPHTLALGSDPSGLGELTSPLARTVFHLAWKHGTRATLGELLSGERWPDDALEFYRGLKVDERMEVLGVAGFYVHELTHKIDLLITPFAAGFHGRACLETLGLQHDAAEILRELRGSHAPLRDLPRVSDEATVHEGTAALQARVCWFDSLRGAAARHVESGWNGETDPLYLLNKRLEKVTVHGVLTTVALPGEAGGYLRPMTILESRAVAVTALNLFHRLGGDDWASGEIVQYVRTFYEPRDAFPDYRFLLDLYASLWGHDNMPTAIDANGPAWLEGALLWMIVIGWYALQSPPVMRGDSFANSSPIIRLVLALRTFEDAIVDETRCAHGIELFDRIDASERAVQLGIKPIREIVGYCLDYVREVRHNNRRANTHPEVAQHFDHIFGILEQQLERRIDRGYASMLGMPDGGDVSRGFEDPDVDEHLLIEAYEPSEAVRRWFRLREDVLFRYARPPGFWRDIGGFLSAATVVIPCECGRLIEASVKHGISPHRSPTARQGPGELRETSS